MRDEVIVGLYWQRDENAIQETERKYGRYLSKIAYNVLADPEDSKESVNDTYLKAWNSMPPHRPEVLSTYLGKITRQLSIDMFRGRNRKKPEWIVSNFGFLEEHDKETFEKIDEEIKAGAMIFFAVENDVALATCMAMPMQGTTWELCKLGSNKNVRLFILSNSKLKPALHIYEKYGFQEIELEMYTTLDKAR